MMVVDGSDSVLLRKETLRGYLAYNALRFANTDSWMGVNVYGSDATTQAETTRIRVSDCVVYIY